MFLASPISSSEVPVQINPVPDHQLLYLQVLTNATKDITNACVDARGRARSISLRISSAVVLFELHTPLTLDVSLRACALWLDLL